MRLHVISDLHLEFEPYRPPRLEIDAVMLAGDIHVGLRVLPWIDHYFNRWPVVYVLGNHEYYRQALPVYRRKLAEAVRGSNRGLRDRGAVRGREDDRLQADPGGAVVPP